MKPKIYIDGNTGASEIYGRLIDRRDVELLFIDEKKRDDLWERKRVIDGADLVILCLPDAEAAEIIQLVEKPNIRVIDASAAHHTAPGWAYGFPELSRLHRARIRQSKRVTLPGCHAAGLLSIVHPLVSMGMLPPDYPLSCFCLGGGGTPQGLCLHSLAEAQAVSGLTAAPALCAAQGGRGMALTVTLHNARLPRAASAEAVWELLDAYYRGQPLIELAPLAQQGSALSAGDMAGKDGLRLVVCGDGEHTAVTALYDPLGKGSAGALVQNLNIMFDFEETAGLSL